MVKVILINDSKQAMEQLSQLIAEKTNAVQTGTIEELVNSLDQFPRRRLIVRRGLEWLALKLEDIVLFYTENKLVWCIDNTGKKFLTDKHLTDLELELNRSLFFRANRQYIVNLNYIRSFRPYEKVKLQVDIDIPDSRHQVIISQENAPQFRKWMFSA